ncbi:small secreted protein [Nemania sp. NC0429]|nr:small secreted protein [Nemania sp. NC0429]
MHFALLSLIAAYAASVQAGVFTQQTYNDISISGGVAGNAQNEALAVFSALNLDDLANVDKDDLDFLNSVNQICNQAEEDAFNEAIDAASASSSSGDEADALQRGKIKNKVLKLTAAVLKLQAQAAQGKDVQDKLEEEQTKLNNNIQQDEDEAGNPSTFLSFDATTD